MVSKYRIVANHNGLIALGRSKGKDRARWSDGQVYYVPASSPRAHSGYESSFDLLRGELEFERRRHPEWGWHLQRAEWSTDKGQTPWKDIPDEGLPGHE